MKEYLEFVDQAQFINEGLDLSNYEIKLLDLTARAHFLKQPIFIGDLIYQKGIASQVTLHRAFKDLVAKNLISTESYEDDGRTKKVMLTERALDRYKRLHRAMVQASANIFSHGPAVYG